ncbi:hypothetical protein FRC0190_02031 [Corynebacterium rouxii]|uniref:Uncharacterized protein n=1 Tax=Corynebacterium rouxii TaxID=2719119 RepID=A0A6I8MHG0_9CORY|nr:hypothetical protein FRC0190_02031 [Corynebacterium rouxii]
MRRKSVNSWTLEVLEAMSIGVVSGTIVDLSL